MKDLVYMARYNPEHLKNWWGPKGFTNTFQEFDVRPGGKWKFTMHGPKKGNYKIECEFSDRQATFDILETPFATTF